MSVFPSPKPEPPPPPRRRFWNFGLGAGLLGASVLAMRWLIRPPTTSAIPETISPPGFSTRAFQSGGGQMIYHESGNGPEPALVFVHGLEVGASSFEWAGVYAAFPGRRRVLAPDLIGFGESERPKHKHRAADCAASLADFITGQCGDDPLRPIVIASGLGAGIAALMVTQRPELVSRLILWMPTGAAQTSFWLRVATRVPTLKQFLYRNRLARRSSIRRRLSDRAGIAPEAAPNEAVNVYALCAQQYQAECSIYRLLQRRLDLDLPAALRALEAPATLLWPERAGPAALEAARRLAGEHRLGTLRIVPSTSPGAPLITPEALITVLQEELQN